MGLFPEIEALLAAGASEPPLDLTQPVTELRRVCDGRVLASHAHVRPPAVPVEFTDDAAPGPAGDVPVRIYRPHRGPDAPRGVHVHLHGGGWWMGSLDTADPMARELAAATGLIVVSVGYRLAPEHRWPAGLEDAYAAVQWASVQAPAWSGGPAGVTVGGESAGGNLTAAVALMARDRGTPALRGCWLDIPAVDLTMPADPSVVEFGRGYGLDIDPAQQLVGWYADESEARHPYVSPAFAQLHDLPPTLVTTAECDPLRDQGERYAAQLRDAGVATTLIRAEGHTHASSWLTGLTASAADWHARVSQWLTDIHAASDQAAGVPAASTA